MAAAAACLTAARAMTSSGWWPIGIPLTAKLRSAPGGMHAGVGAVGHRELPEQVVFHPVAGLCPSRAHLAHA